MPLRIRDKQTLKISSTSDEKRQLFDNTNDPGAEIRTDLFTKSDDGNLTIAPTASKTIPRGDVATIRGVYIEADNPVQVSIDGGTPITITPPDAGKMARLRLDVSLTSVQNVVLTNPALVGGVTVSGLWVVWGDPAA